MPGSESPRSFGHWGRSGSKGAPRPQDVTPPERRAAQTNPPEDATPDATREGLETIAGRRQRREQMVDPLRPAPDSRAEEPTRNALRQLAELRQAQQEPPDLTEGMWERVVSLARPLITPPAAESPPRSPAPRTTGQRRRTPER